MKPEEQKQNTQAFFYLNAFFQLTAILVFQQFGITWLLYIVMAMIGMMIAIQTLAAAISFSDSILPSKVRVANMGGINILISVLYMVSSYHIYLIGFVGFAWFAAAHTVIHLLTNILGASKNDSSSVHPDEK